MTPFSQMTAQPRSTAPARASGAGLARRSVALVLGTVLTAGGLAACGEQVPVSGPSGSSTTAQAPQDSGTTPPEQDPTQPTETSQDPSTDGQDDSLVPVWTFPVMAEGWYLTTWDTDGVNQLDNDEGCSFTTHQNYYSGGGTNDREATTSMVEPAMAAWENAGSSGLTYETSDDVDTIRDVGGVRLESIRMDFSYVGGDGTPFTGVEWVRVFTGTSTPVEMRVSYVCPTDAYSDTDLATLMEDTTVTNPGEPDMDA